MLPRGPWWWPLDFREVDLRWEFLETSLSWPDDRSPRCDMASSESPNDDGGIVVEGDGSEIIGSALAPGKEKSVQEDFDDGRRRAVGGGSATRPKRLHTTTVRRRMVVRPPPPGRPAHAALVSLRRPPSGL